MRNAEIALQAAEAVLKKPRNPRWSRKSNGVRGLAAYVLWHTHQGSWAEVADAVYGKVSNNTARSAAAKWSGTIQAKQVIEVFNQNRAEAAEDDVWDRLQEMTNRIEALEMKAGV